MTSKATQKVQKYRNKKLQSQIDEYINTLKVYYDEHTMTEDEKLCVLLERL
jgi:exonuclease I